MARVTVEDCLEHVDNRFELVLLASRRARQIAKGSERLVALENDKPTVVALREIAEGLIDAEILNEADAVQEGQFEEEISAEVAAETGAAQPDALDMAAAIKAALSGELAESESDITGSESEEE